MLATQRNHYSVSMGCSGYKSRNSLSAELCHHFLYTSGRKRWRVADIPQDPCRMPFPSAKFRLRAYKHFAYSVSPAFLCSNTSYGNRLAHRHKKSKSADRTRVLVCSDLNANGFLQHDRHVPLSYCACAVTLWAGAVLYSLGRGRPNLYSFFIWRPARGHV